MISITWLKWLTHLTPVTYRPDDLSGSFMTYVNRELIFRTASHLDAFSGYLNYA
jgi:hypothetical protein